jgi:N-glycosylase/DNA lyase
MIPDYVGIVWAMDQKIPYEPKYLLVMMSLSTGGNLSVSHDWDYWARATGMPPLVLDYAVTWLLDHNLLAWENDELYLLTPEDS